MPYLIDGHNLIAALPDIDIADPNDEAQLVVKLRSFAARTRKKYTIIFDGGLPGGASTMSTASVKVIFAASQRADADSLIMRRIREKTDAPNWTVVSTDSAIRNYAEAKGMRTMTSQAFARALQHEDRPPETRGEEVHPASTADEIDAWLAAFGDCGGDD